MCPDKKRPAENTCRIVKGLDAVWAHFCPSKPCLPLSIDGTLIAFNPNAIGFVNWQYVADRIVAKKAYNSITISLLYSYNVNEVYFDGIQLFKEEFGHSYVYDSSGTQVVAYTYDAWGNPLTTTGTMADTLGKLNPFRYRGYVYDTETGLYYLQSRYYNPETGRFINADNSISNSFESVHGYNLFAYCFNNPVNMNDSSGSWPKWLEKVAKVVAVAAVVVTAAIVVAVATAGTGGLGLAAAGVAFGTACGGLVGGVALAAVAIVGFIALFQKLMESNEAFREKIPAAWAQVKEAFQPAIDAFNTFKESIMGITETDAFNSFVESFGDGITSLIDIISEVVGIVADLLSGIFGFLTELWEEHGEGLIGKVQEVWEGIVEFLQTLGEGILEIFSAIFDVFKELWDKHGSSLMDAASSLWNSILDIVSVVWDAIKAVIGTVVDIVKAIWNNFGEEIMMVVTAVWEFIMGIAEGAMNFISGIIDVISELYICGIINPKGKFIREGKRIKHDKYGMGSYILAFEEEAGSVKDVEITEVDIDNFIRAKGAIFSAIRTMLTSLDFDVSMIDDVYVAGGIGSGINMQNAVNIGMFPDIPIEKFHYIGNSSLTGAYLMLLSTPAEKKTYELAANMTYMELSTVPIYMDEFVGACFIPHTDTSMFPTVMEEVQNR